MCVSVCGCVCVSVCVGVWCMCMRAVHITHVTMATNIILQVFIAMLVKDRYEKHLIMMEQNGLSRWTYWLVKYCFNFIFYAIIAVVVSVFAFAFQIRLFTQVGGHVLSFSLPYWGSVSVGYLLCLPPFSYTHTSPPPSHTPLLLSPSHMHTHLSSSLPHTSPPPTLPYAHTSLLPPPPPPTHTQDECAGADCDVIPLGPRPGGVGLLFQQLLQSTQDRHHHRLPASDCRSRGGSTARVSPGWLIM